MKISHIDLENILSKSTFLIFLSLKISFSILPLSLVSPPHCSSAWKMDKGGIPKTNENF